MTTNPTDTARQVPQSSSTDEVHPAPPPPPNSTTTNLQGSAPQENLLGSVRQQVQAPSSPSQRTTAEERPLPATPDQAATERTLDFNSVPSRSSLSGQWERLDGEVPLHQSGTAEADASQLPIPLSVPPTWAPQIPNLQKVISDIEDLRTRLIDVESENEALKKRSEESVRKMVEANRLRIEDSRSHLNIVDALNDKIQRLEETSVNKETLKDSKPKFGEKQEAYAYFVTKFAQHFPIFDARKSETELRAWEDYWDAVRGFQRITNYSDMIRAYLIKDSAAMGTELATCFTTSSTAL